jgi:hypothetical protein
MRHLFIILLLSFGLFEKVFADAGNCVKYDVDIQLTDGQKVRGFVYALGYEKRFRFQDISFLDYIKRNNPTDTLHVYRNIRQLKFPMMEEFNRNCEFHFDATTPDNYLKILKKKIKIIKVVSHTVCNNCDNSNEETGYSWNGVYPTIITELTKAEIDLLQTKPFAIIGFGHDIENSTDGYWMISYSSDYKQADLEKLKNDFLTETDKPLTENKWDIVQGKYKVLKSGLRKKKIILFKIGYVL